MLSMPAIVLMLWQSCAVCCGPGGSLEQTDTGRLSKSRRLKICSFWQILGLLINWVCFACSLDCLLVCLLLECLIHSFQLPFICMRNCGTSRKCSKFEVWFDVCFDRLSNEGEWVLNKWDPKPKHETSSCW